MRSLAFTLVIVSTILTAAQSARAQGFGVAAEPAANGKGPRLDKQQVERLRLGLVVTAVGGPCRGILGTALMPMDWPEQQVKVVQEDFSPAVKSVSYRMIGGTVKQMVISMPFILPEEIGRAVVTIEVTRHAMLPPADPSIFVLPNTKKLKPDVRIYLGPSPLIESAHPRIRAIVKELLGGKPSKTPKTNPKEKADEPDVAIDRGAVEQIPAAAADSQTAWSKVETIYDWVRAHVEHRAGPIKGALAGLKDGYGGSEELTSLFIAICRASDIPARTVWVPGHCYPEFYLEDGSGRGYWFPCQAAGNREFGGISELRPILEKGDNFQVPERKDRQRYVAEHLTGDGGKPSVQFLREMIGAP